MFAATTLEQTASTVMYTTLECAIDTDLQLLAISAVSTLTGYYHLLVPNAEVANIMRRCVIRVITVLKSPDIDRGVAWYTNNACNTNWFDGAALVVKYISYGGGGGDQFRIKMRLLDRQIVMNERKCSHCLFILSANGSQHPARL